MRFRILGALQVGDGAGDRAVTAGRDRVVLAMLLTQPGRVVPVDHLVDAVWDDDPPATARGQLQSCVSRLRRVLPTVGVPADVLVTDPAGYGLQVGADDVDAGRFAELSAQARACAAERPEQARELFGAALRLWRGPALVGIDSRAVRQCAAALDELHLAVIEDWVEVELRLGRHRDVLGELFQLVDRHPLRERLRGQLMLALSRSGRQADALAQYRLAHAVLRDELGIEPGAQLRGLHQRLLAGQADERAEPGTPGAAPARCLPRTVADFTGRAEVVGRMVRAVADADPLAPVIQLVDGMPGSGKTTLAVHVANLVADRYPDAQLFIDLHGHSERSPVEPAAALVTLLRQLGVPGERIPADLDERAALWRTELASRRALIVLDNAAGTAQVGPLLPAGPNCLALVTSRRRLAGLDGIRPESLRVLSPGEGVDLLRRIAGDRVAADPWAAAELVRRCGHLPLAIRLAGARLTHRSHWSVRDLVDRLGGAGEALPELAAEERTVANAFALSYSQLPSAAQRLFRLLSFHPSGDFDALAVAALADCPLPEARDTLDDLVDWHLVDEPRPGRYRLHDLVREYAASLAATDHKIDRYTALGNMLDFYVHAVAKVTRPLEGEYGRRSLPLADPTRPDLVHASPGTEAWLEAERPRLTGLIDAASAVGLHATAWRLARAAWRFLYLRGYTDDLIETHQRGLAQALAEGDPQAAATIRNHLASAYYRIGRYEDALSELRQAADLRRAVGDEPGLAATLGNMASVYEACGPLEEVLAYNDSALRTWRRLGDANGMAQRLTVKGATLGLLGRVDEALRCHRAQLQLACESGYVHGVASALGSLGALRLKVGDAAYGVRLLTAALALRRRSRFRYGEGESLNDLGIGRRMQGRYGEAVDNHRQALRIMREVGDRRGEAIVLNDLATTLVTTGDAAGAVELHRAALALAAQFRIPYQQARALDGIANVLSAGDPAAARTYWRRALVHYQEMGLPEAAAVQRRLAETAGPAPPPAAA